MIFDMGIQTCSGALDATFRALAPGLERMLALPFAAVLAAVAMPVEVHVPGVAHFLLQEKAANANANQEAIV